ncbi:branched-chain amino acid aminotransferase [Alkalibaculum bacchi]|uniref:Branched-chain amino acid aminotransferase n=1 Tax=Alkalibaculum bacchi TaxID=645887 RepID=A0A366I870_9FIRM|nr:aminotransferase class IV [Alkalibaculum bacchi]RBP65406.1 branched-chain amino acid aminotransferase [Alkalibaculum bacchi]
MEEGKIYYSYNGNLEDEETLEKRAIPKNAVYEVMKMVQAKPLFFEDHMERFVNSTKKLGYTMTLSNEEVLTEMILLTRVNLNKNTNVQIVYIPVENSDGFDFMVSFTDGLSATDEQKNQGVGVETVIIERHNPAIKTVGSSYKGQIKAQSKYEDTFEILLVNKEGYITEGSRSNVFFVKNKKVITTPAQNVLLGVTRKYILELCEKNQIEVEYRDISEEEVYEMDGAFLTGTTVDVTPIIKVNNRSFKEIDKTIITLKNQYEELMREYLENFEAN